MKFPPKKGKGTWEATTYLTKEVRSHQRTMPRNVLLFHQSQSQRKIILHLLSFQTEVNTPGTSQQFPPTNPEEATFYTNLRRQITRIEERLKQEPDCEDDIPYCPEVRNLGKRIHFNMKPFQGMGA